MEFIKSQGILIKTRKHQPEGVETVNSKQNFLRAEAFQIAFFPPSLEQFENEIILSDGKKPN